MPARDMCSRGLGNASPLGTSIQYVVSPETGEILRVYLTK